MAAEPAPPTGIRPGQQLTGALFVQYCTPCSAVAETTEDKSAGRIYVFLGKFCRLIPVFIIFTKRRT